MDTGESIEELFEGNLKIIQNRAYYRFTSDSILLTRFVKAKRERLWRIFVRGAALSDCIFTD